MYKLLLVTDREEVIDTFAKVHNLADMMMEPVTVIRDIPEAIAYLERNAVDAVGYSFRLTDPTPLHTYLMDVRPSMPIFQTHHHDNTLRDELVRVRAFLDRMRMDDSQEGMDEAQALQYLRDQGIIVTPACSHVSRDDDSCMHCGMCIAVCPFNALTIDRESRLVLFAEEKCTACGMCTRICPVGAMHAEMVVGNGISTGVRA